MEQRQVPCVLCGHSNATRRPFGYQGREYSFDDCEQYKCPTCGVFVLTRTDRQDYLDNERQRERCSPGRLSALVREQHVQGLPPYWVQFSAGPFGSIQGNPFAPVSKDELLRSWPKTVSERLNRTLCNLARLSQRGGAILELQDDDVAIAFAEAPDERLYHVKALCDQRYLDPGNLPMHYRRVALTPAGWDRFEELVKASPSSDMAFVAMWFGGRDRQAEMNALYERAIFPAIDEAGYRAERVDLVEHNEWIMDKVLGLIRSSRFVVADFTGHTNGVYFEAGFARGLGKTVIHTCLESELANAHFDTKQLNHVLWSNQEELRTRLHHRITGTLGRGPHSPA